MNAMQPPQSIEEIKAGLETTEKGGVRQSIRNCLTVFQRDPLLSGAIAYNILTDRKDIIKPIGFHRESTALNDTDMKYLLLYLEETYGLTNEKKIDNAIGIVANENKYHPIRDYLSALVWDGTERIRFCLRHFLGADADDYTCPTWWNRERGLRNTRTKWEKKDPENGRYMWDFSVIKDLLMNPVYTGAIASQKKDYRFKIGTIGEKKPEDWIVVEGQHEPLIDRMSFDIVQNKLKSRQRPGQTNEISLFAGLLKCGECGKSLTIRYTNAKHPQRIYSCKTYNAFGKNHCTQHRIDYDTLYSHVLRKIRECARAALMDGEAVADRLTNTCEAEQREQREAMERSLTRDEERIEVLDKMVMRLYEDMIAGRISEQNFNTMLEKTQTEQTELKTKVSEGRKRLSDEVQLANDAKQWVEAIQEYANITELDAATLNRLIKEIVVHERIDEDKTRHISIEIHFNLKPIPEVEQVTA